jgi:hypothetical protein
MGICVGVMALLCFGQDNETNWGFVLVVGMSQAISAIAAGCSGSVSPVLLAWLLQHAKTLSSSQTNNGLVERAVQDVMTALLTTTLCYCSFAIVVFLNGTDASDACLL